MTISVKIYSVGLTLPGQTHSEAAIAAPTPCAATGTITGIAASTAGRIYAAYLKHFIGYKVGRSTLTAITARPTGTVCIASIAAIAATVIVITGQFAVIIVNRSSFQFSDDLAVFKNASFGNNLSVCTKIDGSRRRIRGAKITPDTTVAAMAAASFTFSITAVSTVTAMPCLANLNKGIADGYIVKFRNTIGLKVNGTAPGTSAPPRITAVTPAPTVGFFDIIGMTAAVASIAAMSCITAYSLAVIEPAFFDQWR